MLDIFISAVGGIAAALTTLSYIPQVKKAWPRGETEDLSLKMLLALTSGLVCWIVYGVMRGDWIVTGSNFVGASLVALVLVFKLRDLRARKKQ